MSRPVPTVPPALRLRLFGAAFLLTAGLVVWLSLRPMTGGGGGHVDKLHHFLAYAGLTLLGFTARGRAWLPLVIGVIAFGAGVEVLQALLPTGRTGSLLDGLANAAGAGTVWAVWWMVGRRRV